MQFHMRYRLPLSPVQFKPVHHLVGRPIAPEGGDEFAGSLRKIRLRQSTGGGFTDHHEDAGAELLNVMSQEQGFANPMVAGDGTVGLPQALGRQGWRQFARIPNFHTISKNQNLDCGSGAVVAMRDGIHNCFGNDLLGQFV